MNLKVIHFRTVCIKTLTEMEQPKTMMDKTKRITALSPPPVISVSDAQVQKVQDQVNV